MAKVLIADDDAVSRRLLEGTLKAWGYEVITAANGQEAMEILSLPERPSLAIIDWVMPGMYGTEVCRRVRDNNSPGYVYIILLTARGGREDIVKGLESGADDYMIKPFYPEELKYRLKIGERIIKLEQDILKLARTDYLTGVLNRRAFMERLAEEIARMKREGKPLGIIIADIDFFKRVNDRYGHQAGDMVLKDFARSLKKACREYDLVGRYGGEEFIICLPGCDRENTFKTAERMRKVVELTPSYIEDIKKDIFITASFGVTSLEPGEEKRVDDLIKEADEALYKAKRTGRNRVVKADEIDKNIKEPPL
ncbi:two-component system, chemotaxis family, response regulator CheY [Thermosyntropha lipolytica DSM 11003]|uniref:Stage 0 sporulation protein A homolog n=1 Tax=Thermosyntropha lipolytica DSM 11003 TaxID=1123382 RepID=A0A1M5LXX1_9FIRM|nr:diguanylate cyclase [Thermosyntropha lipolytica]SHG69954.1 two-component system, chemotaxis family, response regulator CheY [Thermosyntropha lipolytica DSM 11003]